MKVPRSRNDAHIARMTVSGWGSLTRRMPHFVAARRIEGQRPGIGHAGKRIAGIGDALDHQVDDVFLAALDRAVDYHQPGSHGRAALPFKVAGP